MQLQALYDEFADSKGLKILAFPCNQFGSQVIPRSKHRTFKIHHYAIQFINHLIERSLIEIPSSIGRFVDIQGFCPTLHRGFCGSSFVLIFFFVTPQWVLWQQFCFQKFFVTTQWVLRQQFCSHMFHHVACIFGRPTCSRLTVACMHRLFYILE